MPRAQELESIVPGIFIWQVYDPAALLTAIENREEMGSTAQVNGVAIPHPRRPLPNVRDAHQNPSLRW